MCGIIGYIGNDDGTENILFGLSLLQNRGYDSVGLSSIQSNKLDTVKIASTATNDSMKSLIDLIHTNSIKRNTIIAHTRWATHGGKTNENAHPHHDCSNRIAIVHNGIIENYASLKKELIEKGYSFVSQTDTEVISVLLGMYLDQEYSMEESIAKTISRLQGAWALLFVHKDYPNKLWLTRNGSPLLIGIENDICMVVSEQIAFGTSIRNYMVVDNHDIITITHTNHSFEISPVFQTNSYIRDSSIIEISPKDYPHWMIQEIMEQPESVMKAINYGGRIESDITVKLGGIEMSKLQLKDINHLIIIGCGTSYHSGLWARSLFTLLEIMDTISVYDAAELSQHDLPRNGKTAMVVLSQSGETKDIYRCLQLARDNKIITIGIVNVVDSVIARETDCGIYLNAGREVAVASTKSFTNQCIVLSLLAIWFSQQHETCSEKRKNIIRDLRSLSIQIQIILQKRQYIKELVASFTEITSIFLLGKGSNEAIAKEGSLKIKEIVYVHAEGYSSSALKHGPLALLDSNVSVILLDTKEDYRDKIHNAYHEVKARNSRVIMVSDNDTIYPDTISIPKNNTFGGLLANIIIQLISYEWAIQKGYSPDFPRHLAKVVTVD